MWFAVYIGNKRAVEQALWQEEANSGIDDGVFLETYVEPTAAQTSFLERQYYSLNLIEIPQRK